MLDANALAGVRIGPARDVAGGVDARRARLEQFVHDDAAIHRQARLLGELEPRPDADADDDEIGREPRAVVEHDRVALDALRFAAEMEHDALLLVQRSNERAEVVAEHALERKLLRRDDVDVDLARAQRRRDLEADEARADHDGALCRLRRGDDRAAVGERAQVVHVRQIGARAS